MGRKKKCFVDASPQGGGNGRVCGGGRGLLREWGGRGGRYSEFSAEKAALL